MPSSDLRPDDAQMREVVRQLADAAPHAPAWDRIDTATRFPTHVARPWPQVAVAAAVVAALVVGGLVWLSDPDDQVELPADRPTESIAPVDEFGAWVAEVALFDAQLCFTRAVRDVVAAHETELIAASTAEPGLANDSSQRIAIARNLVGPLDALSQHPSAPPSLVADLAPVIDTQAAAELGQFDEAGDDDVEQAAVLIAEATAARDAAASLVPDPDACWFERSAGRAAVDAVVEESGPLVAARCVSLAQFDHAVGVLGDDPDAFGLAVATLGALGRWYDPVPAALIELDRAVVDAEFTAEPAESVGSARAGLDLAAVGLEGCDAAFAGPFGPGGSLPTTFTEEGDA